MTKAHSDAGTPTGAGAAIIFAIRRGLEERANPDKAEGMRAYMKSAMPFRGVQKPAREEIARAVLGAHPLDGSRPGDTLSCACGARRPIARSAIWRSGSPVTAATAGIARWPPCRSTRS